MSFDDIKWKPGVLERLRSWEKAFIKMLLEIWQVKKTISNDTADNMPHEYEIDWVNVSYLTGWTWFQIVWLKESWIKVKNKDEFLVALDAARCMLKYQNNPDIYSSFS